MQQSKKQPRKISLRAFMILAALAAAAGLLTAFAIMPQKSKGTTKPAPAPVPENGFLVWNHWADYSDTFLDLEDELGMEEAFATLGGELSNKAKYSDTMYRIGGNYRTDSSGQPVGRPGVDYGYKRLFLCTTPEDGGDPQMICSAKTFFDGEPMGTTELRNSWETGFEYAGRSGLYCVSLAQHISPEEKPSALRYDYSCARPGYGINTTGSVAVGLAYSG